MNSHTSLLSSLTIDIPFPFLAQTLPLSLSHGPTTFSLVFSHSLSFQRYESTCGIFKKLISWLLQTLLPPFLHSKFLIPLPSFLLLLFSPFLVFSSSFLLSLTSFLLISFSLSLFVFATLVFPALISTASHALLGISSSSFLLFSSQF